MKVSVIIPVYNAADYLNISIKSALKQPQTEELLLIDDRSTDNSLEICRKWEKDDRRVKVYFNEGTKGAGAARNVGLRNAKYDFIAFLDADDYFLDGRFDDDNYLFNNNNEIEVVANSLTIVTSDQKKAHGTNIIFEHNNIIGYKPSYSRITLNNFTNGNSFCITGLTIKSDVFKKVGYFDESLKQCEDTDLNIRLILYTKMISGNSIKPVVAYFRHQYNSTNIATEAVYFRRKAAKKHFKMALDNNFSSKIKLKFFKNFMEYDYLWLFCKNHRFKKYYKAILLPFFLLRILSIKDPEYDKERKIYKK